MNDKNRITVWGKPDEKFLSGYGNIDYQEWCELEKERFAGHGTKTEIIKNKKGEIALARAEK